MFEYLMPLSENSPWPIYSIAWRFGRTHYEIVVENPERRCRGVARVELDGSPAYPAAIPLADDGRAHRVRVVLGEDLLPKGGTSK